MEHIDFFKLQAKNFLKDFRTKYWDEENECYQFKPNFFDDIDDIILGYDIYENEPFSLMNSQHLIACMAGFHSWQELIHSNKYKLELGKLLFENRNMCIDGGFLELPTVWQMYERNHLGGLDDQAKLGVFEVLFLNKND